VGKVVKQRILIKTKIIYVQKKVCKCNSILHILWYITTVSVSVSVTNLFSARKLLH